MNTPATCVFDATYGVVVHKFDMGSQACRCGEYKIQERPVTTSYTRKSTNAPKKPGFE